MSWGSGPLTSPGSWSAQRTQPFSPQAPLWCSRKHLVAVSLSLCFTFANRKRKWEEGRRRVGSGPGFPVRTCTSKRLFLASPESQGSESSVLGQFLKVPRPSPVHWSEWALGSSLETQAGPWGRTAPPSQSDPRHRPPLPELQTLPGPTLLPAPTQDSYAGRWLLPLGWELAVRGPGGLSTASAERCS